jgi:hypothetical protein
MEIPMFLAILAVLAAWGTLFYTLYRWGPGRGRRRVVCPKWGVRARVDVRQEEGDFGRLRVVDAIACTLFPGRTLNCGKECLRQL